LAARNDALAVAGYSVASPKDPQDATLLFSQEPFEAVIIGHSVEPELRKGLIKALRGMAPNIPILFVYQGAEGKELLAGVTSVDTAENPVGVVVALDKLLGRSCSGRP